MGNNTSCLIKQETKRRREEEENIFGNWNVDTTALKQDECARYAIIDNFLSEKALQSLNNEFKRPIDEWFKYHNPIEVKYAFDKIEQTSEMTQAVFKKLSESETIGKIQELMDIEDLEADPYLHGAGLHMHPRFGRLAMHLDYEKHPRFEDKQRAVNIILYLNEIWNSEWNGDTQFWSRDMTKQCFRSFPVHNRAIIFETTDKSWHGVPDKILCPRGECRKTLAFYYIKPLNNAASLNKIGANKNGYREKACFVQRPFDDEDERIQELLKIRPQRRIEEADWKKIWPDWNMEEN